MGILDTTNAGVDLRNQMKQVLTQKGLDTTLFLWLMEESTSAKLARQTISLIIKFPVLRSSSIARFCLENKLDFSADYFTPLKKKLTFLKLALQYSPRKFLNFPILNKLGLQVLRITIHRVAWYIRAPFFPVPSELREYKSVLDRDGILVIENFLPEQDFEKLENFIRENQDKVATNYIDKDQFPCPFEKWTIQSGLNQLIDSYFRKNKTIEKLTELITHRQVRKSVEVSFFRWQCKNEQFLGKDHQFDFEDQLHFDVSYPTVKCFYYLTDTDASNAAFVYAKGSHKMNWARLKYNYELSNQYYDNRSDYYPGHINLSSDKAKELGIVETIVSGKKNTLIIADVGGYHRRHKASVKKPREILYLNYRYVETLGARFL